MEGRETTRFRTGRAGKLVRDGFVSFNETIRFTKDESQDDQFHKMVGYFSVYNCEKKIVHEKFLMMIKTTCI